MKQYRAATDNKPFWLQIGFTSEQARFIQQFAKQFEISPEGAVRNIVLEYKKLVELAGELNHY